MICAALVEASIAGANAGPGQGFFNLALRANVD